MVKVEIWIIRNSLSTSCHAHQHQKVQQLECFLQRSFPLQKQNYIFFFKSITRASYEKTHSIASSSSSWKKKTKIIEKMGCWKMASLGRSSIELLRYANYSKRLTGILWIYFFTLCWRILCWLRLAIGC